MTKFQTTLYMLESFRHPTYVNVYGKKESKQVSGRLDVRRIAGIKFNGFSSAIDLYFSFDKLSNGHVPPLRESPASNFVYFLTRSL